MSEARTGYYAIVIARLDSTSHGSDSAEQGSATTSGVRRSDYGKTSKRWLSLTLGGKAFV